MYAYVLYFILDVTKSISDQLNCDLRSKEINSLCEDVENNEFKCIHLSSDEVHRNMLEHFIDFENIQLFDLIWEEKKTKFCNKPNTTEITFAVIFQEVWKPTIKSCIELLHKLYKNSFTFSDVKYFANMHDVNDHVTALYKTINRCYSSYISLPEPNKWIPEAVQSIKLYQDFSKSANQFNGARLCLNLKELLSVKEDFTIVKDLDNQVRICCKIVIVTSGIKTFEFKNWSRD